MKNLFLLPTDKPSRLQQFEGVDGIEFEICSKDEFFNKGMNIYITSDEEIKEGDWMIRDNENLIKVTKDFFWDFGVRYYKIILTTDQDLIEDGVQAIDDQFLEWFVKNPSCKELKIDLVLVNEFGSEITVNSYGFDKFKYKIIIPKEERTTKELLQLMLEHQDLFRLGLCRWRVALRGCKIITQEEALKLATYIDKNRPSKYSSIDAFRRRNDIFYWEPREIKPRIKWLKKHIARL